MSITLAPLLNKVNFVITVRDMKQREEIEEYPAIPMSSDEEQGLIKDLVFKFLKHNFPGCKIRVGAHSISLRLDGHVHRKANKIHEIWNNEQEWRNWFERNDRTVYDTMRRNSQAFQNGGYGYVEVRERDGKKFLYVPFKPNRIYNYSHSHCRDLFNWMRNENKKVNKVADIYDTFIDKMEGEIKRREEERKAKYEKALNEYQKGLRERLIRPISELEESDDVAKQILGRKMREWARANGKQPYYAAEPTYQNVVPARTNVRIVSLDGQKSKGWLAAPMFDGFEVPEGYTLQNGWGTVTKHDATSERSLEGAQPIVVQDYIYVGYNPDLWSHLLPEGYEELLEVTESLQDASAAEVGVVLERQREEQERARRELEARLAREAEEARLEAERLRVLEEEERQRQEAERARAEQADREARERAEREEAENRRRQTDLTEQLRRQVLGGFTPQPAPTTERREMPDIDIDLDALLGETRAEEVVAEAPQAEATVHRGLGLYRRPYGEGFVYVVVHDDGEQQYVRRGNAINRFTDVFDAAPQRILNYDNPTEVIEDLRQE